MTADAAASARTLSPTRAARPHEARRGLDLLLVRAGETLTAWGHARAARHAEHAARPRAARSRDLARAAGLTEHTERAADNHAQAHPALLR